jgi:hypothetical protein
VSETIGQKLIDEFEVTDPMHGGKIGVIWRSPSNHSYYTEGLGRMELEYYDEGVVHSEPFSS